MSYWTDAQYDAKSTAEEFLDEMVRQFMEDGQVSDDLNNDYPNGDAWHHESHVDKSYNLTDAAELLDELSDFEETDSGLWEGLEPRRAIECQAAFTYGNAVASMWCDLVKEINEALEDLDFPEYENWKEAKLLADDDEEAYEREKSAAVKEEIKTVLSD